MCVESYMYMYCVHVKFTLQYNGGNKEVYMPIYLYPESQGRNPFKVSLSFPINNFRKNIFEAYKYYDKCFQRKNL